MHLPLSTSPPVRGGTPSAAAAAKPATTPRTTNNVPSSRLSSSSSSASATATATAGHSRKSWWWWWWWVSSSLQGWRSSSWRISSATTISHQCSSSSSTDRSSSRASSASLSNSKNKNNNNNSTFGQFLILYLSLLSYSLLGIVRWYQEEERSSSSSSSSHNNNKNKEDFTNKGQGRFPSLLDPTIWKSTATKKLHTRRRTERYDNGKDRSLLLDNSRSSTGEERKSQPLNRIIRKNVSHFRDMHSQPRLRQQQASTTSSSDNSISVATLPKVLALYFPQYHPDPLNDRNWGINFTDWDSLRAAPKYNRFLKPIPRPLPLNTDNQSGLGYYDMRSTQIRHKQGKLAQQYQIDGFLVHHYWFYDPKHAGPNLHAPLEALLRDNVPNVSFAFNWCNQKWTNVWMGRPVFQTIVTSKNRAITLQEQYYNVSNPEIELHYKWLSQFFHHPNYIRVRNQPVLMIYLYEERILPILQYLRQLAQEDGFDNLYYWIGRGGSHTHLYPLNVHEQDDRMRGIIRRHTQPFHRYDLANFFNNTVAYPYPLVWMNTSLSVPQWCHDDSANSTFAEAGATATYAASAQQLLPPNSTESNSQSQQRLWIQQSLREIPGVVPVFDNTPRREYKYSTIWNADTLEPHQIVARFQSSLEAALYYESHCVAPSLLKEDDEKFVIINAWNEWAEGMSLEPSDVYGYQLLEAVSNAKDRVRAQLQLQNSKHKHKQESISQIT